MPTSWEISAPISAMRAPRPSARRSSNLARSSTGVADHAGNAAAAARTARSTSSAVPSGIVPITASVVESNTERVSVLVEGTHDPSM